MGRLPETYPAPIHTWSFGKELLWVFLGGEVVVDYQLRLEKNLDADKVWVAAYTDDVFAYVASERMRAQGGYEVDFSMIYYNQPGRWESGTEDLIERRVKEILADDTPDDKPRTAQQALESIHVPAGYKVDLMAAEPLVNDPVNIAFGHDGRVRLNSDYPLGCEGGGRVRIAARYGWRWHAGSIASLSDRFELSQLGDSFARWCHHHHFTCDILCRRSRWRWRS